VYPMYRQHREKLPLRSAPNARGFSIVELTIVVAIMMILSAFAIPQITTVMRTYQLNSAASQVADSIKFARFEAIRRNVNANCLTVPSGSTWMVGADSNGNGTLDTTERRFVLSGNMTFLPSASVSIAGSLPGVLNVSAVTTLSASSSTQTITFDPRGAVYFAGSPTVYVFYVGAKDGQQDYRAVVVMPSGQTQVWAGSSSWHQIS